MRAVPTSLKSMLICSMLFVFTNPEIQSRQDEIRPSHPISRSGSQVSSVPTTGTLDVVAIMVEFQPDSNRFTSGTGVFGPGGLPYMERAEDIRVEPLPHDRPYFEAHLDFARNYFEQASDGQLTIDYQVLPEVYRLDQPMEFYSPVGEEFTGEPLALLIRDAWEKVEESGGFDATGLDPENTAFIIFHAGIGRDIQLTGTSLDITPQDIPSIYLRKEQIGELLEDPSFNGFEINNGAFRITNSMILPRTESRRGLDIQENEFVFPLSINGLLCASIGSHLGLPDLFNTETGEPAIGRFGLMDGAGFFAYNGLLPPEPSAWSKVYLGWQQPIELDPGSASEISLQAASRNASDNIVRVSLSELEYFLIENRHRDPDSTGVTLTIRDAQGNEIQQTFTSLDEQFVLQETDFDTLLSPGVIVNASNFDFSLPGGLDIGADEREGTDDDRILNGGMLIWHIDEGVIEQNISEGRVNTDPDRRGVDVEEADGAQDIGPGIPGALDNSAAFGSPYDFWWSGNNFRVLTQFGEIQFYENHFGPDTRPDNASNSGSPSFFELYDFSENLAEASFRIRPVNNEGLLYGPLLSVSLPAGSYHTPDNIYWDRFPLSLTLFEQGSDSLLIIPFADGMLSYSLVDGGTDTLSNQSVQQPLIFDRIYAAGNPTLPDLTNEEITIEGLSYNSVSGTFDSDFQVTTAANNAFLSTFQGDTLFIDGSRDIILLSDDTFVEDALPRAVQRSAESNGLRAVSDNDGVRIADQQFDLSRAESYRVYTGSFVLGNRNLFYILTDESLIIADPDAEEVFREVYRHTLSEWPAFSTDGRIYVVNRSENQLEGYNPNGGQLPNTPVRPSENVTFLGTPLITDIDGDLNPDILVYGREAASLNVYGYDDRGQLIEGFPLNAGSFPESAGRPIKPILVGNTLYTLSGRGTLRAWRFSEAGEPLWTSTYGNAVFRGNVVSAASALSSEGGTDFSGLLNSSETYNWPNPADQNTNIRFETSSAATVNITIADLSGRVIYEDKVESSGGFPEEFSINTAGWSSGPYFCMIKASDGSRTDSKMIKIAIVH